MPYIPSKRSLRNHPGIVFDRLRHNPTPVIKFFPCLTAAPFGMKSRVGIVKRNKPNKIRFIPTDRLIMVAGNYGSGKTEVAVNLAIALSKRGFVVSIADLDIVNPYFRCREARTLMEKHDIRVVMPPASLTWADLPIIVPEIKGMLNPEKNQVSLFDVGGDEVGARLLSSFVDPLGDSPYALWQVINSRRPFTDTVGGCLKMKDGIEKTSRLKVTGFVVNSHLMQETTPEVILEGYHLARQASEQSGVPTMFVTAMNDLADAPGLSEVEVPVLRLKRYMLPPWIRPEEEEETRETPAGRTVPIGRPQGAK